MIILFFYYIMNWKLENGCIIGTTPNFKYTENLSMFGLDAITLTKSGSKTSVDENDWKFRYNNVQSKLNSLTDCIIIVTNNELTYAKDNPKIWVKKIEHIVSELNIEVLAFYSIKNYLYNEQNDTFFRQIMSSTTNFKTMMLCGNCAMREYEFSLVLFPFPFDASMSFKTPEIFFHT